MVDPVTLGLIGGGLGAIGGFFKARGQKKEAERRENVNRQLSALDNAYATLVSAPSQKLAEMDPGAGGLAGALSGGVAGFQGGSSLAGSLNRSNAYADMLKRMRGSAPVSVGAPMTGVSANLTSGPMSGMIG